MPIEPFQPLRAALDQVGLSQAVLSHPETLASLGCFETRLPGWGGIRLEHVFVVGADGNEILTRFEHTL